MINFRGIGVSFGNVGVDVFFLRDDTEQVGPSQVFDLVLEEERVFYQNSDLLSTVQGLDRFSWVDGQLQEEGVGPSPVRHDSHIVVSKLEFGIFWMNV